jgi:hypothetical protein
MCGSGWCFLKTTYLVETLKGLSSLSRTCRCQAPHEVLQRKVRADSKELWPEGTTLHGSYNADLSRDIAAVASRAAPSSGWRQVAESGESETWKVEYRRQVGHSVALLASPQCPWPTESERLRATG